MKKQAGPNRSKLFYLVLAAKPWKGWVPKAPCKGGFWTQSPAMRVFGGGGARKSDSILDQLADWWDEVKRMAKAKWREMGRGHRGWAGGVA